MVFLVDFSYLHAGSEHLLSLSCAEVDSFVWIFLKKMAVNEPSYLEDGLSH
jgi:hypothetical protein